MPDAPGYTISDDTADLARHLSAEAWADRRFPEPTRLLGDIVTKTSRTFLIGATGLGKTMFGMAMAAGMATGAGLLDWRSDRAARVLYIDGEMPGELVQVRLSDALRRVGRGDPDGNLFVYCADSGEELAKRFPTLGIIQPLNSEDGQNFVHGLIDMLGGVDVVIFDNVMSLIVGDQKDEVPWSDTLPLISALTRQQIGQVWLDHTGHNTARQYGSSTKAWRFDAVGIMTELPEEDREEQETAFRLSFDSPGKARRRTPDNWGQFAPRVVRLVQDEWVSDRGTAKVAKKAALTKTEQGWLGELNDMFCDQANTKPLVPIPGMAPVLTLTREQVRDGFRQRGRFSAAPDEPLTGADREKLRSMLSALKDKGKIAQTELYVWLSSGASGSRQGFVSHDVSVRGGPIGPLTPDARGSLKTNPHLINACFRASAPVCGHVPRAFTEASERVSGGREPFSAEVEVDSLRDACWREPIRIGPVFSAETVSGDRLSAGLTF